MKRRFQGLHEADPTTGNGVPEGLFFVRVARAQYRWHPNKPYYSVRFNLLEPKPYAGQSITGRIYCTSKALWKLTWFLRDFGYDAELFSHEEIDDRRLVGLQGVVKISRFVLNGATLLNFDGFAPATKWQELSSPADSNRRGSEVA
jgi:hypothetical protein